MSNRVFTIGGLAVAGGVGYYLYAAGGDPKVAQKQAEADASKLSSQVKGQLPGTEKQIKKDFELGASEAGQKMDRALADAKAQANKADAKIQEFSSDAQKKLEQARKDTGATLNSAVDKFDKNVTEGAAKSKSWIGGMFGGSEKK